MHVCKLEIFQWGRAATPQVLHCIDIGVSETSSPDEGEENNPKQPNFKPQASSLRKVLLSSSMSFLIHTLHTLISDTYKSR